VATPEKRSDGVRIAVFGKTGQVGRELARYPGTFCLGRAEAEFTDPESVRQAARMLEADAIINATAYTAVDKAEAEKETAHLVNAVSLGALAEIASERGIPFLHISTDYVFDGSGARPWQPDDPAAPLGAYGRTKFEGEEAVRVAGGPHVILRTSWVFSAHGANFVKTMLRLGAERDALRIVADQIGGPTPAAGIASALVTIARELVKDHGLTGTYHYAGAPYVSWADFARAIFEEARLDVAVEDIPTSEYPTPAARPLNSRLACNTTTETFGIGRPVWRAALRDVIAQLKT